MTKRGITPYIARKIRADKGLQETKLEKLRIKKGLSQTALAAISGVSMRTIQNFEQQAAKPDNAKLTTLVNLCVALDCKIEDILETQEMKEKFKLAK